MIEVTQDERDTANFLLDEILEIFSNGQLEIFSEEVCEEIKDIISSGLSDYREELVTDILHDIKKYL